MNLLCTELAGKKDYSEKHNSLTSNLLFVDLCICVGEYFSGTKREFKFVKCLVWKNSLHICDRLCKNQEFWQKCQSCKTVAKNTDCGQIC